MVDINMSLDDYAKEAGVGKRNKPAKQQPAKIKPSQQQSTRGGRGGARGGRGGGRGGRQGGRTRSERSETGDDDRKPGRSDGASWKHDKFEGRGRAGSGSSRTQQQNNGPSRRGVTVQLYDASDDLTATDANALFSDFSKDIELQFDDNERFTGNINIVCENMGIAKKLISTYENQTLDGNELNFRILPKPKNTAMATTQRPEISRAEARMGSERGRGRGGRGGRLTERNPREEIKQKRDSKKKEKKQPAPPKPKTQAELDAEMEKFAMKNATPQTLDEQLAAFASAKEAANEGETNAATTVEA